MNKLANTLTNRMTTVPGVKPSDILTNTMTTNPVVKPDGQTNKQTDNTIWCTTRTH